MPSAKTFISGMLITIAGVVVAGLLMNALRDNDFVRDAIRGFDS